MHDTDTPDPRLAAHREPFPPQRNGKLPKGGVILDYVGHADVTDRLLNVDPFWSWEPMGTDAHGLPAYDERGNLWIRLTVCGVTRLGVGDGPDPKQRISDAIRNAAMRFGVALDLWAKGDRQFGGGHDAPPEWRTKTLGMISGLDDDKKQSLRTWIGQEGYGVDPHGWDEDTCKAIRHRIHQVSGA